ncbi:MAG: hypothetical protein KTR31_27640 [Myxococcales bacterium]|nr:hypothetical protein [Myxococcales bacterium]
MMRWCTMCAWLVACAPQEEQPHEPQLVPWDPNDSAEVEPPEEQDWAPDGVAHSVPIYGGTLATSLEWIVMADPGNDAVWVMDPILRAHEVPQPRGSEPFRATVVDGRVVVTRRGDGRVVEIDAEAHQLRTETEVCAEPRGVAWHPELGVFYVACASGELVTLDEQLEVTDSWPLARDLRDVVVDADGTVWVSRFRSAQVLQVTPDTQEVVQRLSPDLLDRIPRAAWRMQAHPERGVLILHQGAADRVLGPELGPDGEPLVLGETYYGDPISCSPSILVTSHLSWMSADGEVRTGPHIDGLTLPVDFDVRRGGDVLLTGPHFEYDFWFERVYALQGTLGALLSTDECVVLSSMGLLRGDGLSTSVAYWGEVALVGTRSPVGVWDGSLRSGEEVVPFREARPDQEALRHFHLQTEAQISCASCHMEGQEDGHTWLFTEFGPRRTQSLGGGLLDRAPFHWDGAFPDLDGLMADVFETRMGAIRLTDEQEVQLGEWLHDLDTPEVTPQGDHDAVERGRALFGSPEVGCIDCHQGSQLTDSLLHVVVPGADPTKTPSLLGVGARNPYMHTGCAPTLMHRFTDEDCGGGDLHGTTSHLGEDELRALVSYLQSL